MAKKEHLKILQQGVKVWNKWRKDNPNIQPDLEKADLRKAKLDGIDFSNAFLWYVELSEANLDGANFENGELYQATLGQATLLNTNFNNANLQGANLSSAICDNTSFHKAKLYSSNALQTSFVNANLSEARLSGSILAGANFTGANLTNAGLFLVNAANAIFKGADLTGAELGVSNYVEASFEKAILKDCGVYGVAVWNTNFDGAIQSNLRITKPTENNIITVENMKMAQFVYLIVNNEEIRDAIDTVGKKIVLILGRFKPQRKTILDALKTTLQTQNYVPVVFDFDKPESRDLTETIGVLARLSRFVIADLTEPSSIPHELMSFVPHLPSVPVKPIILKGHKPYAMIENLMRLDWFLDVFEYESESNLLSKLQDEIVKPAESKVTDLKPPPL